MPLEAFSEVVEAIYDCALKPNLWSKTVRLIADVCESQVCIIGVHEFGNAHSELAFNWGYEDYYIRLHEEKYRNADPFFHAAQLNPVGMVSTQAMLVDEHEFWESSFYREWCKPQGLHDMATFKIIQTDQRAGWLALNRRISHRRYDEADVRLMSLLSPHVCRSIAISDALNLNTIRSEALEATLNALVSGVYLVDRLGRVVFMNRAAESQIAAADVLAIANDQIAAVDATARRKLSSAVSEAIADEAASPPDGVTIALPGSGRGLLATVLPLTRGERRNVCGAFSAMAAIFVQDPVTVPPFPGEAFARLYRLTGSELRVLLAMAPGLGVKDAAEVLGVSATTAKTHLQHIYAKTGTSKQTELMRLFMSSAPPVRAERRR